MPSHAKTSPWGDRVCPTCGGIGPFSCICKPEPASPTGMKDTFGVEILSTDRVRVTSWGYGARLIDCGTASAIVRVNRKRVVIIDCQDEERAVGPTNLGVLRRDGSNGYEGNKGTI